jgi:DNA-binding response OmpR family regulator
MATRRILIVEDHDGMRAALRGLFRQVGWDVVAVATVADGLAALEPPPECAIVDLHVPDKEVEAIVRKVNDAHSSTCVSEVYTGTDDEARIRGRSRPSGRMPCHASRSSSETC